MRFPTDHICQDISESWKRITANITAIVKSLTELQMVFRRLYDKLPEGNTDEMKRVMFLACFVRL